MAENRTYDIRSHDTVLVDYKNKRDLPGQDFTAPFRFYIPCFPYENASKQCISLAEQGGNIAERPRRVFDEAKPESSGPLETLREHFLLKLHLRLAEHIA